MIAGNKIAKDDCEEMRQWARSLRTPSRKALREYVIWEFISFVAELFI
jgi:hypothetical protein